MRWRYLYVGIFLLSQTPILAVLLVGTALLWPFGRMADASRDEMIVAFDYACAMAIGALAALGWTVFGWEPPINTSLSILAGFIVAQTAFTSWWGEPDDPTIKKLQEAGITPDPKAWAGATQLSIGTQGVVLGLVAFAEPSGLNVTERWGAASLAAGVVISSILYLMVVRAPPWNGTRSAVASLMLTVSMWTLGFGLICVVAGNWS